jgi:osmotically-inducible protein OsmY
VKLHGPDYGRNIDGTRSHRGRGPLSYRRPDELLYEDVCEALSEDPDVDATNIDVTAREGEITLSGYVRTRAEKHRADDIADRILGVHDVHNQLRVQSPEGAAAS